MPHPPYTINPGYAVYHTRPGPESPFPNPIDNLIKMKTSSSNYFRFPGGKFVKTVLIGAALIASVILAFSLGSVAGEFFSKLF